jgi:hypothetical protein
LNAGGEICIVRAWARFITATTSNEYKTSARRSLRLYDNGHERQGGDRGAEHKSCAVSCAKAGNPIGLLTEKGEVCVMMGIKDHQPGKDVLIEKMAETVTVEGALVKKGGTQVIYVSAVK